MGDKRVLIVGSGGREHAIGIALAASPEVGSIAFAGGENAGLSAIATSLPADAAETADPADYDLVVVGPEAPLVDGLADRLRAKGLTVFGPSAAAAQLEGSKAFTKRVAERYGIPTARAVICETRDEAMAAIADFGAPVVVKADGLAAGKGVTVAETVDEATAAVTSAFEGAFGSAGHRVVIEEKLTGPEVSLFALCDGETIRPLATARDYKRAYDGDLGPNTGGMGAVSPAPGVSDALVEEAMATIARPAIDGLRAEGAPYNGVLYAGLMLTADGPKLIEFNVRFGDPEAQVILNKLGPRTYSALYATATGTLADADLSLSDGVCVGVVAAAQNYPAGSAKGEPMSGLDAMAAMDVSVMHAGTRSVDGAVHANGGRVLAVVGQGPTAEAARKKVYSALNALDWPGGRWRNDIAAPD